MYVHTGSTGGLTGVLCVFFSCSILFTYLFCLLLSTLISIGRFMYVCTYVCLVLASREVEIELLGTRMQAVTYVCTYVHLYIHVGWPSR